MESEVDDLLKELEDLDPVTAKQTTAFAEPPQQHAHCTAHLKQVTAPGQLAPSVSGVDALLKDLELGDNANSARIRSGLEVGSLRAAHPCAVTTVQTSACYSSLFDRQIKLDAHCNVGKHVYCCIHACIV
eukprot:jgi/Chrzof1/3709/Cz13g06030.t1